MEYLIVIALALVVVAVAIGLSRRSKAKGKRTLGSLSGSLVVVDEIYRPNTAQANAIQEAEQRMPAPAPIAGAPGPDPLM